MPLIAESYDSLPYADPPLDLTPAQSLIATELGKIPTTAHPLLPPSEPWSPSSPLMQQELDRVARKEPLNAIDLSKYSAPTMPGPNASINEWKSALHQAYIAATALSLRSTDLSLLKSYGQNAWLIHLEQLSSLLLAHERQLETLREEVKAVNVERKRRQVEAKGLIEELEGRWRRLVRGVVEVEVAGVVLEGEVEELRRKKQRFGQ
ncbi:hypothetical protein SAICODRAFT_21810 [Saitoella complicata NRRL Y-17804]|uniref:uncharacterized protein n=1 Tax=Saitoella complicata (strain BCRC 22490 / CBS 7301 / JCM 7358 / NBRC 10748 / NRRL Y-17804) TaxID=698492 RepID=UPI0008677E07|nr:uncharacterized protein SAICODRAFT_21810 [Saitoella complicata NRRL Y-17804]ODQ50325.1 hypothetical protein SAICODRAFT_21810 [Saitoella complicata NRRL Y-17804]